MTEMRITSILSDVAAYYTSKLEAHGSTPQGVDWNDVASRMLKKAVAEISELVTGTVTVNYTNGSSESFNQTFSDWCGFGANANESIAVGGINRINSDGTLNSATCNVYAYTYALDPHGILRSVTLTNTDQTSDSFVFSITLQSAGVQLW